LGQEEESKKMPKIVLEHYVDYYDQEHEKKYSEGDFLYGQKQGVWTYYYQNGQKQEQSEYTNGKLSGQVIYWFESGQRQSLGFFKLMFQNGLLVSLRDSVFKEWHPNGNTSLLGSYEYDVKDGIWKYWFPEGDLWKEISYKRGKAMPVNAWDKTLKQTLKNGDGTLYDFWEMGPLKSILSIQDSSFNGLANKEDHR
jgi:antitoxin component YwqK of YwqJK toxin-antitoxin module